MRDDALLCAMCPKMCRFACPVAGGTADEGATPTAMMQSLLLARGGRLSWEAAAEALSRCTGCEACRVPCEFGIDIPSLVYRGRAEARARGAVPRRTAAMQAAIRRTGNPLGADLRTACAGDAGEAGTGSLDVVFWPGCRSVAADPGRAGRTLGLLRAVGSPRASLPPGGAAGSCCGAPLRVSGDPAGFAVAAAGQRSWLARAGTLVTPCSQCLLTFAVGFEEAGAFVRPEVLHLAEYLCRFRGALADLGRLAMERARPPLPRILVHDSCGLFRRSDRAQAVHEVIHAVSGVRPEPFAPEAGRTSCCGAGDFYDLRDPRGSAEVAAWSVRDRDIPEGARVVTGDATCLVSLRAALPAQVPVDDLEGFLLGWLAPAMADGAWDAGSTPRRGQG